MGRVESQNSGDIGSFIVNAMALGVEVIHALATAGVQHVGVAPGSRSTPLAVAVADNSSIEHTVHFDERGLGFWAVGVAQAKRVPVGVIVTSGTAVANLLPAVIEANYSGLPLIILSADRPQELIDVGANQAIRQSRLLAEHCRFAVDLHVPSSAHEVRYWASAIAEAIHRAIGPTPGPVHINFRFREPFHAPFISPSKFPDIRMPATKSLESRANTFRVDSNAIIIIGALVADPTIVLSQVREWNRPILLDGASGISGTFPGGNWVPTDYCPPSIFEGVEQIIHIGGRLLSKSLGQWLSHWDGDYVHITETSDRQDPMSLAKTQIVGLDGILSAQVDLPDMLFNLRFSKWSQYFTAKLSVAASSEWSELGLLYEVIRRIPESWAGFVGNSLTVRLWSYLRGFAPTVRRWGMNRGASGIDGLVATASGFSVGRKQPLIAVLGDLSVLHDLPSLALIAKLPHVILIVVNNDGGGIFNQLSVADSVHFKAFFQTPHGLNFSGPALMMGMRYFPAVSRDGFNDALEEALQRPGATIIETAFISGHVNELLNGLSEQLNSWEP